MSLSTIGTLLSGTGEGACEIEAVYLDAEGRFGVNVRSNVTRAAPGVTMISLSINGPMRLRVGDEVRFGAFVRFSDGSEDDVTMRSTWINENASIVEAEHGGVVTARGSGTAHIAARFEDLEGAAAVTVERDAPAGSLTVEGPRTLLVG